ncbi:GNAT family N-acetyltransferase [Candidatus Woesearchaeota archaeon]|nr:GNAT family N-acetyltransferase [Candidatus Woesearchaeota archaeon]
MHIRKAKLSDLPAIEHWIHKTRELQSPTGHDLGAAYNQEVIKNGIALVAEIEEHSGGFLLAEADKKTGYAELLYLVVLPKYRGLGIGARLLDAYLEACKKRKIKLIFAFAPTMNKKAVQFFKKHGFAIGKPMTPFYKKLRP